LSGLGFQVLPLGSLQDHFDIGFSHRLTQIPLPARLFGFRNKIKISYLSPGSCIRVTRQRV
jgi:hypothetical protein